MKEIECTRDQIWQRGHHGYTEVVVLPTGERIAIGAGKRDRVRVYRDDADTVIAIVCENGRLGYAGLARVDLRTGDPNAARDIDGPATAFLAESVVFLQGDDYTSEVADMGTTELLNHLMQWWD